MCQPLQILSDLLVVLFCFLQNFSISVFWESIDELCLVQWIARKVVPTGRKSQSIIFSVSIKSPMAFLSLDCDNFLFLVTGELVSVALKFCHIGFDVIAWLTVNIKALMVFTVSISQRAKNYIIRK